MYFLGIIKKLHDLEKYDNIYLMDSHQDKKICF
ncbi:MAG: hypothetical protein FADNKDHG_01542 [Holosporales bacterium]